MNVTWKRFAEIEPHWHGRQVKVGECQPLRSSSLSLFIWAEPLHEHFCATIASLILFASVCICRQCSPTQYETFEGRTSSAHRPATLGYTRPVHALVHHWTDKPAPGPVLCCIVVAIPLESCRNRALRLIERSWCGNISCSVLS